MLSEQKTKDFILHQIENLSQDGLAEVAEFIEFLQFREKTPIRAAVSSEHVAFGIWADLPDAQDPAAFALKLREKIEKRLDG